jgi:hypothetical protein
MTQSAIADRSWVIFYLLQKTWDSIFLISLNSHTTQLMWADIQIGLNAKLLKSLIAQRMGTLSEMLQKSSDGFMI